MTCRINNYILIICTKTWICPSWRGFHWECHILDIIVTIFFFNSETNLLFHKKYIQRVNKYLYLTLKFYFILWYYLHSFFIKYHFDHFFFSGSICSLRLSPCDWCFESFISKWCLHRISSGRFRTSSPLSTRRSIWSMLH